LIPDWTYFHCPAATLQIDEGQQKIKIIRPNRRQSNLRGSCQSIFSLSRQLPSEWPENQILIPDWTYFHCPGTTQHGG